MNRQRALDRINLKAGDRIPHWESISNPDYEKHLTGIDPWDKPRSCRIAMFEKLPVDIADVKAIPPNDDPIERLDLGETSFHDDEGGHAARWGAGKTWAWDWGKHFKTVEDAIKYEPLEHMDLRGAGFVADYDYRLSVDELAAEFQAQLDETRAAAGDRALVTAGYYNTLFMWPLLTFGWELFLELGALHPEDTKRLLKDFAVRSRKIFQAWAKTDVELLTSHDDICFQRGPVFSPVWLRENIYPYYEEFWGIMRDAGKKVVMICDGNVNMVCDDVFAAGADGMRSESYTDWDPIMEKHPEKIYVGDGDNRILFDNDPAEIEKMVVEMVGRGKKFPGYFLSIGNHLPWNLSVECIDAYFAATERHANL